MLTTYRFFPNLIIVSSITAEEFTAISLDAIMFSAIKPKKQST